MLQGPEYAISRRKRSLDVLVASGMLVPAGLGFLAVRRALKGSGESTLFYQTRVGLGEVPFEMIKLHTRDEATDQPLFDWAEALRLSRLDESTQALNILGKQMSVRGHRPRRPHEHVALVETMTPSMRNDYELMVGLERPGLLGSYTLGRHERGDQSHDLSLDRAASDIEDFKRGSLAVDIELIMQFAGSVILRDTRASEQA